MKNELFTSFCTAPWNNNNNYTKKSKISLPYTAEAMAIFPTYLATSFINKFCSPQMNRYSPLPTKEVRRNKMVQWTKIKCVTLRSARSYSPVFFSLLQDFSHQKRSATTHASHREREKGRGGTERPMQKQRERGILGVVKGREQFLE